MGQQKSFPPEPFHIQTERQSGQVGDMKPSIPVLNGNFHAVQNRLVTYLQKLLHGILPCSGHERTGNRGRPPEEKSSPLSAAISLTIIHSFTPEKVEGVGWKCLTPASK